MCIRMTLSPTVFWISSNGSCTDNGPWSESSFSQNQIRVSLHIVASSNQPIIGSRGKCGLCVPVNRIISMYVCMYVCMYVSPFLWAWSCIVWLVQLKSSTGASKGKIVVIENVGNLRLTCRSPGEKAVIEIMYKEIKGHWEFLYDKSDLADRGFAFLFNRVGKKFKCYWS